MRNMDYYNKSKVHQQTKQAALERYLRRPEHELRIFLGVYKAFRKGSIKDRDSRWKIPQADDKLCIKEHIQLIEKALESKKPVVINVQPAVMGIKDSKA